jgi:hypothetical protein
VKLSPEDFQRKSNGLFIEYLASGDADEACECIKELGSDFHKALEMMYMDVLEKKERDRTMLIELVRVARQKDVVSSKDCAQALSELIGVIEDLEMDVPMVSQLVVNFISDLVAKKLLKLAEISEPLGALAENGKAAKVAAQLVLALRKELDDAGARQLWADSGIELMQWLHPEDRDDQHLHEFVADKKIDFLFPVFGCQRYLTEAFTKGENPATVLAWLKANVAQDVLMSADGACTLMRALLTHFGSSDKSAQFKTYAAISCDLYGDEEFEALQLQLVYAVQQFCHEKHFPEGMLRRLFHSIYDHDTVLEDTFTAWKEDTSSTAGKQVAVLHANSFLQWLAEAEEEEDEEA